MLFGDKLKKIRLDNDWSQEELAKILGTSKQVISRYETNQRTPKITVVAEYAALLHIPLLYLLDDTINDIDAVSFDKVENAAVAKGTAANKENLSQKEKQLLDLFRKIPTESQGMTLSILESALKSQGLL